MIQDATCSAKPAFRTFWPKEGFISEPPSRGSPDCEIPNKVPPAIWTILQIVSNVTKTKVQPTSRSREWCPTDENNLGA